VDHVVTPVGAFGLIVAEDALDRFLVKWIEARTQEPCRAREPASALQSCPNLSNRVGGKLPGTARDRSLSWQ
jgi:hypothetical protein